MNNIKNYQSKLKYEKTQSQAECTLKDIYPVKINYCKIIAFIIFTITFIGFPLLLIHWYPKLKRFFYYENCKLQESTHVALLNEDDELSICQITNQVLMINENQKEECRVFINRYLKYIINHQGTVKSHLFDYRARIINIFSQGPKGNKDQQATQLRQSYGMGTMIIDQPSPLSIFSKELLRPLCIFLFFSVGLWAYLFYYYYAGIILFSCLLGVSINTAQLYQLNNKIYNMAYNQIDINVLRDGDIIQTPSLNLVPGDIVFLNKQIRIPFDGVILQGNALINECALTGESVPIVKKADGVDKYKNGHKIDKNAFVYQGTTVIQTNAKATTLFKELEGEFGIPVCVIRTNFATTKGQLIRTILFPKQKENTFQRQSVKFLFFLFAIVIITFLGMIPTMGDIPAVDLLIRLLNLITIAVPPALPVSMSFGIVYAIEKLKKKSIFCIQQSKVIVGGGVNFSCFDKTGTLTQDFMDFECLVPADNAKFYPTIYNRTNNQIQELLKREQYLINIFNNIASNHSIVQIQGSEQLVGDPMEIKLLQFGQFKLNQSNNDPQVIFSYSSKHTNPGFVYKRFDFDFDSQRMSVISKALVNKSPEYFVYTKGSPQIMLNIMDKNSIPSNYQQVLKEYASNGFRVLTIASKKISANYKTLLRKDVESELIFNGFQVFENKLKNQTKAAIKELKDAQIGVVMITGDNSLTAANIGYKCGIINSSKAMLICDYKDGKFTRQKFNYHQQQQCNRTDDLLQKVSIDMGSLYADIQIKPSVLTIQQQTLTQIPIIQTQVNVSQKISNQNQMQEIIKHANTINGQLCVTGKAFNKLFEETVGDLTQTKKAFLEKVTIFARTTPKDKAKIVMMYQHSGKTVSMCGDGANDCAALKQADIGLSLSQTEASISAPFTSQVINISSMVQLIKQCRAGLATNFSLFNIVASYALIQYTTTIIAGLYYAFPADFNYLYWDVFCNFFFIVVIGYTASSNKLSVEIPNNSLFCLTNLMQFVIMFSLQMLGQISMILALSQFSDDIGYSQKGGMDVNFARFQEQGMLRSTPQTNILFLFTNFMYISTLLAFTISRPWKRQVYTNIPFMLVLFFTLIYSIILTVVPSSRLAVFYLDYMTSARLNGFVLGIAFAFGIFIILLQKGILEPLSLWLRRKYPHLKWL